MKDTGWRGWRAAAGCVLLLGCAAGAVWAADDAGDAAVGGEVPGGEPDAAARYEALFGTREAEARRTRTFDDDLALAEEIAAAVQLEGLSSSLRVLMCDKAFDLASRSPDGYDTAAKAMARLEDVAPDQALRVKDGLATIAIKRYLSLPTAQKKQFAGDAFNAVVDLAEAQMAAGEPEAAAATYRKATPMATALGSEAGDTIRDGTRRATALSRVKSLLSQLEAQYRTQPTPDKAARIATVYVTNFNLPVRALPYAEASEDATLRKLVPLAAGPVDAVPAADALALAQWYESLAGSAGEHAKPALLMRADGYYTAFLEVDDKEDFHTAQARVGQKRVADQLAKLGVSTGHITGGIDLFRKVAERLHLCVPDNRHWSVDAPRKALVGETGNEDRFTGQPLNLPIDPGGDETDFTLTTRVEVAKNFAAIIVPVGNRQAMVVYRAHEGTKLGGSAQYHRQRKDQRDGEPVEAPSGIFEVQADPTPPGEARNVAVQVKAKGDTAAIEVRIDDHVALQWTGPFATFSVEPNRKLELATRFALAPSRNGRICIFAINIKGKVRSLDTIPTLPPFDKD